MNIKSRIIEALQKAAGITKKEAEKVYNHYLAIKVLKIDAVSNNWTLIHGVFFDKDVILRAVAHIN